MRRLISLFWVGTFMISAAPLSAQETIGSGATNSVPRAWIQNSALSPALKSDDIWTAAGIGLGFRAGAQEFDVSSGAGWETRDIGGKRTHDLLISKADYGYMLGNEVATDKWYGGNFEFMPELFGAWQYRTVSRYVAGGTLLLRYNFATGTRWDPFLDFGIGGTLTNIGHPDLGSLGEFNGQVGPGLNYFWRRNVALTVQYRYMHISSGGLSSPNQGVNENIAYVGVSFFF